MVREVVWHAGRIARILGAGFECLPLRRQLSPTSRAFSSSPGCVFLDCGSSTLLPHHW